MDAYDKFDYTIKMTQWFIKKVENVKTLQINYRQNVIRMGHNYNLGFQQKEKEDNFLIK